MNEEKEIGINKDLLSSILNDTNEKENEMNNNIEERIDKLSKENKVLSGIAIILLLINLALIFIIK